MNINHSKDDFIILGCDGIFDVLSSQQVIQEAWQIHLPQYANTPLNLHNLTANIVERVIKKAIQTKSTDNLTAVLIAFPNFQKHLTEQFLQHANQKQMTKTKTPLSNKKNVFKFDNYADKENINNDNKTFIKNNQSQEKKNLQFITDTNHFKEALNVQSTKNACRKNIVFKQVENNNTSKKNNRQQQSDDKENHFQALLERYNQLKIKKKQQEQNNKENANPVKNDCRTSTESLKSQKSQNQGKLQYQRRINKNPDSLKSLNDYDIDNIRNKQFSERCSKKINGKDLLYKQNSNTLLGYNFNNNQVQKSIAQKQRLLI